MTPAIRVTVGENEPREFGHIEHALLYLKKVCHRCGGELPDGWEHSAPMLHGHIALGYPAQIGMAMGLPGAFIPYHEAALKATAQEVEFRWGEGSHTTYRMCRDCQGELLHALGVFFWPDRVVDAEAG